MVSKTLPATLNDQFRKEKCVLFVGSGISIISGLPSWSNIVNDIKLKLKETKRRNLENFDYLQLAQYYEDLFGRKSLLDFVVDKIKRPGFDSNICHDMIARLPLRTIITTNWDTLLERAYARIYNMQPIVVWKDVQVGFVTESQGVTVIKMHGCITDPDSLVFTEQDYFNYLRSHPLLVDLISTKLANSPMLFLGYSVRDLDFKLMLERIISYLGSLVPSKHLLLANETDEEAEYLEKRGFSPILIKNEKSSKTEILKDFLKRLTDKVAIHAYTKLDRAKILLRENRGQLKNADSKLVIRNSTNLGAWAIPKPEKAETPIFDLYDVDKLEWDASKTWEELYVREVRFKCIYCINAEWMLRKYPRKHAEKRLRVFFENIKDLNGSQVQIVSKDSPFDYSITIFNKDVLLQLTKSTPDERTYTHAEVVRNKLEIARQINIFDTHFQAIKRSNLANAKKQGIYREDKPPEQNLHEFIVKKTKEVLEIVSKTGKNIP